jgi:hypothetical protein
VFQILYACIREVLGRNSFSDSIDFDREGVPDIQAFGKNFDEFRPISEPQTGLDASYNPFDNDGFPSEASHFDNALVYGGGQGSDLPGPADMFGNNDWTESGQSFDKSARQWPAAGYGSNAVTAGCGSNIVTAGEVSNAATVGDHSRITTKGGYSRAATVGDFSHVTTVGHKSHAMAAGDSSQTTASGYFSIAAALGANSKAKAALGSWIVLAEYDYKSEPLLVKAAKVDGQKIKADTFYKLENGEFVEA